MDIFRWALLLGVLGQFPLGLESKNFQALKLDSDYLHVVRRFKQQGDALFLLRKELLHMVEVDQAVRQQVMVAPNDRSVVDAMQKIDQQYTQRLQAIITQYGWPHTELVGEDGAQAAWLLVQHSENLAFQKECLLHIKRAVDEHKARPADYAYLYDRIAVYEGRRQRYGTQVRIVGHEVILYPLEDETAVDRYRQEVGLEALQEYKEKLKRVHRL